MQTAALQNKTTKIKILKEEEERNANSDPEQYFFYNRRTVSIGEEWYTKKQTPKAIQNTQNRRHLFLPTFCI